MYTSMIVIVGLCAMQGLARIVDIKFLHINSPNCLTYQNAQRPIVDRDDGSGLSFEEDRPRIDRFAEEMKRDSSAEAYIITYGGLLSYKDEARIRLRCIQKYLLSAHRILRSRLKLIDGGYRAQVSVELFLIHAGDPKPTPFAIVNRKAVRIKRAPNDPCGKAVEALP